MQWRYGKQASRTAAYPAPTTPPLWAPLFRRIRLRHLVADAKLGEDVGRVVSIVAQLAADGADGGADGPHVAVALRAPDPVSTGPRRCAAGQSGPGGPIDEVLPRVLFPDRR